MIRYTTKEENGHLAMKRTIAYHWIRSCPLRVATRERTMHFLLKKAKRAQILKFKGRSDGGRIGRG